MREYGFNFDTTYTDLPKHFFSKNKSLIFHIVLGILMSVMIYYLNFIFSSLGNNGKLPVYLSIFFPLMIISLISIICLVNINDK